MRKTSWACISKRKCEVIESQTPCKPLRSKWTDAERTAVRVRTDAGDVAKSIGLGIGRSDNAIYRCRKQFKSSYAPRVGDGSRTKSGVTIRLVERAMLTLPDHAGTRAQVYGAVLQLAAKESTPIDTGLGPGECSSTRAEQSVSSILSKHPQFVEAGKGPHGQTVCENLQVYHSGPERAARAAVDTCAREISEPEERGEEGVRATEAGEVVRRRPPGRVLIVYIVLCACVYFVLSHSRPGQTPPSERRSLQRASCAAYLVHASRESSTRVCTTASSPWGGTGPWRSCFKG